MSNLVMIALRRLLPITAAAVCAASALLTHYEEAAQQARCDARKAKYQWELASALELAGTVSFDFECDFTGPPPQMSPAGLVTMAVGTPALIPTVLVYGCPHRGR